MFPLSFFVLFGFNFVTAKEQRNFSDATRLRESGVPFGNGVNTTSRAAPSPPKTRFTDSRFVEGLWMSCQFSFRIDLPGQSCADICAAACGLNLNSYQSWAYEYDTAKRTCLHRLKYCAVPVGKLFVTGENTTHRPAEVIFNYTQHRNMGYLWDYNYMGAYNDTGDTGSPVVSWRKDEPSDSEQDSTEVAREGGGLMCLKEGDGAPAPRCLNEMENGTADTGSLWPRENTMERNSNWEAKAGRTVWKPALDPKAWDRNVSVVWNITMLEHTRTQEGNYFDPLRLTYATAKIEKLWPWANYSSWCLDVKVMRRTWNKLPMTRGGGTFNFPNLAEDEFNVPDCMGTFRDDPSNPSNGPRRIEDLDYYYSPTFHQMLQQWYLSRVPSRYPSGTTAEESTLAVIIRGMFTGNLNNTVGGVEIDQPGFQDEGPPRFINVDMFYTFAYHFEANLECRYARTCARCNTNTRCSWCDMSAAFKDTASSEAGWDRMALSTSEYGSACGVPPVVCALMGGRTYDQSCPPQRDQKLWQ